MDWIEKKKDISILLVKYRWVALVFVVGLLLMILPQENNKIQDTKNSLEDAQKEDTLEDKLERMLSKLEGAGRVNVLLSVASGPENYYQTDEDIVKDTDSLDKKEKTVIVNSENREQIPVVRRTDPPVYLGAVVLCQGADSAAVRLAVVDAVGTATGLTSDKISVLKMK